MALVLNDRVKETTTTTGTGTINLGGATIDSDGTGTVSVSATGVTLPAGSKAGGNKLAVTVTGSGGAEQAAQVVDFFSAAGGLSSANTQFSFILFT